MGGGGGGGGGEEIRGGEVRISQPICLLIDLFPDPQLQYPHPSCPLRLCATPFPFQKLTVPSPRSLSSSADTAVSTLKSSSRHAAPHWPPRWSARALWTGPRGYASPGQSFGSVVQYPSKLQIFFWGLEEGSHVTRGVVSSRHN